MRSAIEQKNNQQLINLLIVHCSLLWVRSKVVADVAVTPVLGKPTP